MNAPRERLEPLTQALDAARQLLDDKAWVEARAKFAELAETAKGLGIDSAYLLWARSLIAEHLDEVEAAFDFICAGVVLDPMHPTLTNRFAEASTALRQQLIASSLTPDGRDPKTMYEALLRAGEADAACHVAMARAHVNAGELDAARGLLDSIALLEPNRVEAWEVAREVARRREDPIALAEAEARLAALADRGAPYGMPSPRTRC